MIRSECVIIIIFVVIVIIKLMEIRLLARRRGSGDLLQCVCANKYLRKLSKKEKEKKNIINGYLQKLVAEERIKAMFCIYLRTNSDLCHLQHKLTGFYNPDEKCLQRGTDWVFK